MNKKTYLRPTTLERNVRVSMMCLSPDPIYGATSDTFVRGEDDDIVDLKEISAQNDDIWGNNDYID